jgi:DNA-binding NarL/FixJ family response regulator
MASSVVAQKPQSIITQNANFNLILNKLEESRISQKIKALALLDTLYQIANTDKENVLRLTAYCMYEEASLNSQQQITDSLLTTRIRNALQKNLQKEEKAVLYASLGLNLLTTGQNVEGFSVLLQAHELFKQLDDVYFMAKTLNFLGTICKNLNLHGMAISYFTEAIKCNTSDILKYKINLYTAYDVEELSVIDSMLLILHIIEKDKNQDLLPIVYLNLISHLMYVDGEETLVFLNKMASLDFDNPRLRTLLSINIIIYYIVNQNYKTAMEYLESNREIMLQNTQLDFLYTANMIFSIVFEGLNQYDSALYYARECRDINEQIKLSSLDVQKEYITIASENFRKDLMISEQKSKLKNSYIAVIASVSLSVVLLALIFLFINKKKKQQKEHENQILLAKLEADKKMYHLEKEKQKEVIDAKNREVISSSLSLANKNHVLQKIHELSQEIYLDKTNAVTIAEKIDDIVDANFDSDKEWKTLTKHFEEVHPDFFKKLKERCQDLTNENLKICAYIKIGITNKQIAALINITHDSFHVNKSRLRKKLGLADSERLDDFLQQL